MQTQHCIICQSNNIELLPSLNSAMLSDGQITQHSLNKSMCLACGLGFSQNHVDIHAVYNQDYALGAKPDEYSKTRNTQYAQHILTILSSHKNPKTILEIGAGNGELLAQLAEHLPDAKFTGIEPAPQARTASYIEIKPGFFEETDFKQKYDFIFSVNVIEHTQNPEVFLAKQAELLTNQGKVLVICPDGNNPSVDLLFYDHLYHFTQTAFAKLAQICDLAIIQSGLLGDFQYFLLKKNSLAENRKNYLQAWQDLDHKICQSMTKKTALFGAGEMANLCRCYLPNFWEKIDYVCIDNPKTKKFYTKPLITTNNLPKDYQLYLAVADPAQQTLKIKLADYQPLSIIDLLKEQLCIQLTTAC